MTSSSVPDTTPLEILAALHHAELRNAAADVAAALAHAAGTPLNVIGGRAALIRQDPSNALAQVARIEEQVNKLATGLRQLVDYLAPQEPPRDEVSATSVLEELGALFDPVFGNTSELVVSQTGLGSATVDRTSALCTLNTLVSWAVRTQRSLDSGKHKVSVTLTASIVEGGVAFDLALPDLPLVDGWRLENFAARPAANTQGDPYRMLSICGALARGQGNKLVVDAAAGGQGVRVRYLCKAGAA